MAARKVISSGVVWDNHGCMPLRADDRMLPELRRYYDSGVDMVSINIGCGEMSPEKHLRLIAYFRNWLLARPDKYVLAVHVDDILQAKSDGKLAVAFDIEGALAIDDQISLVGLYYDLGVRWMLIAYNRNNLAGGGCHDEDHGLTDFGRRMIDEMERVGMVVCCSHTGPRTSMNVMDYASGPVIFSHSNARALCDHPRNISDQAMKACARTGGVIGINGIGVFLGGDRNADTEDMVRHIDYAAQLVGAKHVGLGLDCVFDHSGLNEAVLEHGQTFPPGMGYEPGMAIASPEQIPEIPDLLTRLGYAEDDIKGILGENFLRVARQVWK